VLSRRASVYASSRIVSKAIVQSHGHRHTHRNDCFTWTTKVVGNNTPRRLCGITAVSRIDPRSRRVDAFISISTKKMHHHHNRRLWSIAETSFMRRQTETRQIRECRISSLNYVPKSAYVCDLYAIARKRMNKIIFLKCWFTAK